MNYQEKYIDLLKDLKIKKEMQRQKLELEINKLSLEIKKETEKYFSKKEV